MSAASFQSIRACLDPNDHARFDSEMAKLNTGQQGPFLDWIRKLLAVLAQIGATVNIGCLFSQAVLALVFAGNLMGALTAYMTCAHPVPVTP